jgi:hypothetical protein
MTETIHSYWDYIEPYWDVFDIYNGHQGFESSIHNAPRPVVLLYAAHFCQSEVHNGGFLQFFWNNTGVLAPEAIEGYGVIGMPTLASSSGSSIDARNAVSARTKRSEGCVTNRIGT